VSREPKTALRDLIKVFFVLFSFIGSSDSFFVSHATANKKTAPTLSSASFRPVFTRFYKTLQFLRILIESGLLRPLSFPISLGLHR
jgi:hypothetical protein